MQSLDHVTVAKHAAAQAPRAAPKGGRAQNGGRTDAGALAGQEDARSFGDGVDYEQEFGAVPRPGGIVWNAMQAKYTPEAFARIIYKWGESKGKAAMASREHPEVGLFRPERQEKVASLQLSFMQSLTSWVSLQQIGCTKLSSGCKLRASSSQLQRS